MQNQKSARVRIGLLTLPIGGLIGVVAPLPSADPAAWIKAVRSG